VPHGSYACWGHALFTLLLVQIRRQILPLPQEWAFLPGIKIRPFIRMCISEFWLKNISASFFMMRSFPFEENFQSFFFAS
jgi:hypothetical protein